MSHITPQMQKTQRIPSKINITQNKTTYRHHFKLQKTKGKEKLLKKMGVGNPTYVGIKIRIASNLSLEPCKQEQSEIFKMLREKRN